VASAARAGLEFDPGEVACDHLSRVVSSVEKELAEIQTKEQKKVEADDVYTGARTEAIVCEQPAVVAPKVQDYVPAPASSSAFEEVVDFTDPAYEF